MKRGATRQIRPLSKYELLLIGTALYWGEGWKKETQRAHSMSFVNSDPEMIKLFLRFAREILRVPEDELHMSIRVHTNINEKEAMNFWSQITNISKEQFRITRQISKSSQGKRLKNSLPCGTLSINVYASQNFFHIKGWIDGLIEQNNFK